MIKYFTIEDLLKHYLQKKFHILLSVFENHSHTEQFGHQHSFMEIQQRCRVLSEEDDFSALNILIFQM